MKEIQSGEGTCQAFFWFRKAYNALPKVKIPNKITEYKVCAIARSKTTASNPNKIDYTITHDKTYKTKIEKMNLRCEQ